MVWVGAPLSCAASMNGSSRTERTMARVSLMNRSAKRIPTAIMALVIPGPRMATIANARIRPGSEKTASTMRMTMRSHHPPA